MNLQMKDPQSGRLVEIEIPDWKLMTGMMGATASFRSLASLHVMAAMVANPDYHPHPEQGEDAPQAYLCRAATELHRSATND